MGLFYVRSKGSQLSSKATKPKSLQITSPTPHKQTHKHPQNKTKSTPQPTNQKGIPTLTGKKKRKKKKKCLRRDVVIANRELLGAEADSYMEV